MAKTARERAKIDAMVAIVAIEATIIERLRVTAVLLLKWGMAVTDILVHC